MSQEALQTSAFRQRLSPARYSLRTGDLESVSSMDPCPFTAIHFDWPRAWKPFFHESGLEAGIMLRHMTLTLLLAFLCKFFSMWSMLRISFLGQRVVLFALSAASIFGAGRAPWCSCLSNSVGDISQYKEVAFRHLSICRQFTTRGTLLKKTFNSND